MKNQIPVYLFIGFLEGGKTHMIQESLEDERFNSGEKTMLICCEEGIEFTSLLIAFAAPPAISSFTMAQQMDSDYTVAGESVIVASALSCFTIFIWVFLYSSLGVI